MTSNQTNSSDCGSENDSAFEESPIEQLSAVDRQLIAAMVSHELREPINAILSFLNVTLHERIGKLNELQTDFLQSTESAARRLERRIDDVQVALLEGDALKPSRDWIHLNARVIASCRELEWAAEKYSVTVLMNLEQSSRNPGIWADPDRLDQVLINLLENAIRYAPPNSEIRITTTFKEQGYWSIIVENDFEDDLAIDPKTWFQAGFRMEQSEERARPGLGLGLTIANHLVLAHNGQIWADVKNGRVQVGFSIPHRPRNRIRSLTSD